MYCRSRERIPAICEITSDMWSILCQYRADVNYLLIGLFSIVWAWYVSTGSPNCNNALQLTYTVLFGSG
jgi:hypothetical protein